ncbi:MULTISPECIES: hypothetical protein [unclassified Streptomyces]|uniref:Uncharacterized protein n=1 Tax=Streptomyces sp. NBC_00060 TaxID=2975636 RepID=A0AAU2GUR9_9ACTN
MRMRNSRNLAEAAIVAVGMAGMLAVCGPTAQAAHAAPTGNAAAQQVGGSAASTATQTVGFSGKVIEFKDGRLQLATANGDVTFELTKGTYRYGSLQPGFHAYVAAYEQNDTWVATSIFTYP